jgi:hypothetical protein
MRMKCRLRSAKKGVVEEVREKEGNGSGEMLI